MPKKLLKLSGSGAPLTLGNIAGDK